MVKNFMVSSLEQSIDQLADSNADKLLNKMGNANWRAYQALSLQYGEPIKLEMIMQAAESWKEQLSGIDKPWLVWSVDEDWAYVQQQLVQSFGWTPVVGYDPRAGRPKKILDCAVLVDFNKGIDLPIMYMHFPIEFVFLFAPRLAFWHSDLLVKPEKMRYLSNTFESLKDGEIAMTNLTKIKNKFLQALFVKPIKLFELAGCITNSASQNIFDTGCGLWQGWAYHPNCPGEDEFNKRLSKHWDHGAGLLYWKKRYGGKVKIIQESYLDEGHFSRTSKNDFKVVSPNNEMRNTGLDLKQNYNVYDLAKEFGITVKRWSK